MFWFVLFRVRITAVLGSEDLRKPLNALLLPQTLSVRQRQSHAYKTLHGFYTTFRIPPNASSTSGSLQISRSALFCLLDFTYYILLDSMVANAVVTTSGEDAHASLPNNTHDQWIKDAGLRRLNLGVGLMFTSAAANGYDGSLMNGLLALPLCMSSLPTCALRSALTASQF
jgi:hypothetical protein